jgi:hypothetical protein
MLHFSRRPFVRTLAFLSGRKLAGLPLLQNTLATPLAEDSNDNTLEPQMVLDSVEAY